MAFALWIGYGVLQSRRSGRVFEQVSKMPRGQRGVLGATLFLVGAMVLIGGLAIVMQSGGFTAAGLTLGAWLAIATLGLAFVHAQTMGMAMLVSLVQENVTNGRQSTSINRAPGDTTQP